jgi:hypothetical protein
MGLEKELLGGFQSRKRALFPQSEEGKTVNAFRYAAQAGSVEHHRLASRLEMLPDESLDIGVSWVAFNQQQKTVFIRSLSRDLCNYFSYNDF